LRSRPPDLCTGSNGVMQSGATGDRFIKSKPQRGEARAIGKQIRIALALVQVEVPMANEGQSCKLCKKAPRRKQGSLLCQDCADAVNRVMPCDVYEANRNEDRRAQLAQMRLLVRAAKSRGARQF
jgi:hypothetical protein